MRILMVCLGNICRSPLAEGILAHKVRQLGLDWQVDSAGTGYWHTGQQPDKRSIRVAQKHGIDITYQRARQIKAQDFDHFDHIYAMDKSNLRDILLLARTDAHRKKVRLIMLETQHPKTEVPDPYYDDDGFDEVFEMLDLATDAILSHLAVKDKSQ